MFLGQKTNNFLRVKKTNSLYNFTRKHCEDRKNAISFIIIYYYYRYKKGSDLLYEKVIKLLNTII